MKTVKEVTKELDPNTRILHLRNQIASLTRDNDKLRKSLGSQEEFANDIKGAIEAADPYPAFRYTNVKKGSKPVTAVLKLSDWHVGERVSAQETEGYNRYNWALAQLRIYSIVRAFLNWVEVQRAAYNIEECALFCEGDYVSGDIHGELKATNEFPLPVQTARAGMLLGEVFRIITAHFDHVTAYMCGADNHGRLTPKPQAKQKTTNNMSFLVHELAKAVASDCKNLDCVTSECAKILAKVGGWRFLIEHGDSVRGWGGNPYYGFDRMFGKEAKRRMNTDKGFDYWSIAHFHVPAIIDNRIIVNGSLSGTSEFDHLCGRHSDPAQVAFLVHPTHGWFNWVPFHGRITKPNRAKK